ncbi:MAG TPA: hypothetical protein VGC01_07795 [Mucilaginibacter sp.]
MIEKVLKTTQGKLRIKIPTQLKEVTLGQMMRLQQKHQLNDLDAISILSGVTVDELNSVQNINDFQIFGEAILSLSHQIKHLYNSDDVSKTIVFHIDKKPVAVKVITNLSMEPAGAFMASSEVIADEINEHIKLYGEDNWKENFNPSLNACCHILAHYFYCRATCKKYNEYKAEEFTEEIKKLRVSEALPIAKHFFTCYPNLSKQKTSFWHLLLQFWKKKPAFNRLESLNT